MGSTITALWENAVLPTGFIRASERNRGINMARLKEIGEQMNIRIPCEQVDVMRRFGVYGPGPVVALFCGAEYHTCTQSCPYKCIGHQCPPSMPHRYPGTKRCFERVWDGKACNVDGGDTIPKCQCNHRQPIGRDCDKTPGECPTYAPNRYPHNNRCFETVWGGMSCNVDPKGDPLAWQKEDLKCRC